MRKKAQDQRKKASNNNNNLSPTSSSSLSNCSSSSSNSQGNNSPTVDSVLITETKDRSFYDTGGFEFDQIEAEKKKNMSNEEETEELERGPKFYSMDEIWKDIEMSEDDAIKPVNYDYQKMDSPQMWDYLWMTEDEESSKMFPPPIITDHQIHNYSFYNHNISQDSSNWVDRF